jgi:glutaredoxin
VSRPSERTIAPGGSLRLAFQERDTAQDRGALADLKKLGYMTTPVIVIDGAVIVGFDSAKIDEYVVG